MGIPESEPDFTDGMTRDELAHGLHMAKAEIDRLMRLDKDTVKCLRAAQAERDDVKVKLDAAAVVIAEFARRIVSARDALIKKDVDEAYHQLYAAADKRFTSFTPWEKIEALAALDKEEEIT